jgi:hypothetical protein
MSANYYKKGSYNIICDRCRCKFKREDCQKEWNGLLVCKFCWDPKHPELTPIPAVIDGLPVPDARPRPTDTEVTYHGLNKWDYVISSPALNGRITWNAAHFKWNEGSSSDTGTGDLAEDFPLR